jgi:hypothetical protein
MTTDPPSRQCGAVRREGNQVLRCGRPAIHVEQLTDHGNWVQIGELDPDHGGISMGRILDALWERTSETDPDAWRPPDDGDRAAKPPEPVTVPPGVDVIPAGRSRGEGMEGIEQIRAHAGQIKEQIEQARGLMEQATIILRDQQAAAERLLHTSVQEAASAVVHRLRASQMGVDDAIANAGVAIEQIEMLIL